MGDLDLGKKVFFLYPPSVIHDDLVTRLLDQEYEVYMIKSHQIAEKLFARFPDAICFVNIDAGMGERDWEGWIRAILANPATKGIGIGIVTYNADEALQKKYLMDIGITCGFVKLKLGMEESTKILLTTLKAAEAKGRRKFVRASCEHDTISSLNVREGQFDVTGTLRDMSVVGFSCVLDPDPEFQKNTVLHDIQLRLRGTLVHTEAIVFGKREEERTTYVMLFTPRMEPLTRQKIRAYIQAALQFEIERIADEAPDPHLDFKVQEEKSNGDTAENA
jgi:hypothetical protein